MKGALIGIVSGNILTQKQIATEMRKYGYKSVSFYEQLDELITLTIVTRRKISGIWYYA